MRVGRKYTRRITPGESNSCLMQAIALVLVLAIVVSGPAYCYYHENYTREMSIAFTEYEGKVVPLREHASPAEIEAARGNVVHVHTPRPLTPHEPLSDGFFALPAPPAAVRLRRDTEYCQWLETKTRTTREDAHGERIEEIQYYYALGWHSHRIPSVLFDQPFAHHNPQRDPAPSYTATAASASAGAFTIDRSILATSSAFVPIDFSGSGGQQALQSTFASAAAYHEGFRHIGGHWFYSAYEPSMLEGLMRAAGGYAEGSLFDWQIGDLFKQCTPGDIRVRFSVVAPGSASFIGELLRGTVSTVSMHITDREFELGLMQEGEHNVAEMLETAFQAQLYSTYWSRGLLFGWALVMSLVWVKALHDGSWGEYFAASMLLFAAVWSALTVVVWSLSPLIALVCVGSCVGFYFVSARLVARRAYDQAEAEKSE